MATVLPSSATTDPPCDQSTPVQVLLASLDFWLMAIPIGLPLLLRSVPTFSRSSQVSTGARPLASKISLRYSAGKSMKYSGTACHVPSYRQRDYPDRTYPLRGMLICLSLFVMF